MFRIFKVWRIPRQDSKTPFHRIVPELTNTTRFHSAWIVHRQPISLHELAIMPAMQIVRRPHLAVGPGTAEIDAGRIAHMEEQG